MSVLKRERHSTWYEHGVLNKVNKKKKKIEKKENSCRNENVWL